jgi:iron complex transport system substrate-binding protein
MLASAAIVAGRTPALPRPAASPRVVVDARGRAVPIPLPFNGTAMLFPPSIDDYLLTTRQGAALVAAQTLNRSAINDGLMGRMFPALHGLHTFLASNAAVAPNVESLLMRRPSAVFVPAQVAGALERVGLPALGIVNTLDERWAIDRARMYAEAIGKPERGPDLLARYHARISAITRDLATVPAAPQARVLLLSIYGGAIYGIGRHNALSDLVRAAGGANALDAPGTIRLDRERLLLLDPDVVLLLNTWPRSVRPGPFLRDPAWHPLRAVRERRVYRVLPGIEFFPDGLTSYPLFVRWLAELLHPGLPTTLRAEMRATYRHEADYAVSEADLDEALAVVDNRGSAGARRFEAP